MRRREGDPSRSGASEGRKPTGRGWVEGCSLALPVALVFILHGRSLGYWWTYDDPCLLHALQVNGILSHFTDPDTWRGVSGTLFMPWVMLSFGLDDWFFGLTPVAFYGHQLLSLCLLILVGFSVLRFHVGAVFAGVALSLFVASLPGLVVAQKVMNRTYIEGLAFVLLSVLCHRRALLSGRSAWAVVGAFLYLGAASAKEVFAPVVLLLPFSPYAPFSRAWRYAIPYFAAGVGYLAWRDTMLLPGRGFEAYGSVSSVWDGLTRTWTLLGLGDPWFGAAAIAVGALFCGALVVGGRRWAPLAIVAPLALLLPLGFLGDRLDHRHLFPLWFVLCVAAVAVLHRVTELRRGSRAPMLFGLALVGVSVWSVVSHAAWRELPRAAARYAAEGQALFADAPDQMLIADLPNTFFLSCTRRLARTEGFSPPGFCGDPCYCARAYPDRDAWVVRDGRKQPFTPPSGDCARASELNVEFSYDVEHRTVSWRLGPYSDGRYRVLLVFDADGPAVGPPVPLPGGDQGHVGRVPFLLDGPLGVVVRYESPAGWASYSAMQSLRP